MPSFLPYFIATAARSAPLVDYLIFHERVSIPWERPPNVKFVDLGGGGLAELVGLKLGEQLNLPLRAPRPSTAASPPPHHRHLSHNCPRRRPCDGAGNATVLLRSLRLLFEKWPRLVAEYKPTFGSVFEDFLSGYSHWGYCDLDMVIGNLG